jgi:pyruvate dehydrogenase complex dehydrogenase (E1) component
MTFAYAQRDDFRIRPVVAARLQDVEGVKQVMDEKGNVVISHDQLQASADAAREWAAQQLKGGGWASFGKKTPAQQAADDARKEENSTKTSQRE